jgi:hypothetical protein
MDDSASGTVAYHYRRMHDRILSLVDDLTATQLAWRPLPAGHSINWTLWHLARRSDYLQASLPSINVTLAARLGPGRQIWDEEELAARWGVSLDALEGREVGRSIAGDVADGSAPPNDDRLLDYARRAFAAVERAVGAVDDAVFRSQCARESPQVPADAATVGDVILLHLVHHSQHVGEIACLRGLQGLRGTTR